MDVEAAANARAGCVPQATGAPESLVAEGSGVEGMDAVAQPERPGLQAENDVEIRPGAAAPLRINQIEQKLLAEVAVPPRAVREGGEVRGGQRTDAQSIVG